MTAAKYDPAEVERLIAEARRCKWCSGTGRSGFEGCFVCLYCEGSKVLPSAIADHLVAARSEIDRLRHIGAERLAQNERLCREIERLDLIREADAVEAAANHTAALAEIEALRCGDLVPFQDGELSSARAEAFRVHLGSCADCRTGLEELVKLDARLTAALGGHHG